jgi:hypothetical protein
MTPDEEKILGLAGSPLPIDPTRQALANVTSNPGVGKASEPANIMSAQDAGALGLSAGDVAAAPGILEKSGHVVPSTASPPPPPDIPKVAPAPAQIATVPMMAKAAPTLKDMLTRVLHTGPEGDVVVPVAPKSDTDYGAMLANLGKGAGDFLQRWGLGLQGKGDAQTRGDIERAQQADLAKQKAAAEIQAKQQAIDQQYMLDRMNVQNQMNVANLPVEKKAELANTLAAIEAQHQARLAEFGPEAQQRMLYAGMNPKANPGSDFTGQ